MVHDDTILFINDSKNKVTLIISRNLLNKITRPYIIDYIIIILNPYKKLFTTNCPSKVVLIFISFILF